MVLLAQEEEGLHGTCYVGLMYWVWLGKTYKTVLEISVDIHDEKTQDILTGLL